MTTKKLIIILLTVFCVLAFANGLILIGTSFLPFEIVKPQIDMRSSDGNAAPFTKDFYDKLTDKIRFIGIALLLTSGAFFIIRHWIQRQTQNLIAEFPNIIAGGRSFYRKLREEEKLHIYGFLIILLVTIAVRAIYLFQPMRYDESYTYMRYASKPLWVGLSYYTYPNNHLFHTFLVHITTSLFGNQQWAIRIPAFIAGVLIIPATYLVMRSLYDKHSAILGTALVGSSSYLVEFSTNARGYTIISLIFLCIIFCGNYARRNGERIWWLLIVVFSALGFYTVPIMLYPFGIFVVWLLMSVIFDRKKPDRFIIIKRLVVSCAIVAILTTFLYIPVFAVSGIGSVAANRFVTALPREAFFYEILHSPSIIWSYWNRDIPIFLEYIFVLGFFISLIFHKKMRKDKYFSIALSSIIWIISLLLLQRVFPFPRVLLFLLPLYLGLSASGIRYILQTLKKYMGNHVTHIFVVLAICLSISLGINVIRTQSVYYAKETGSLLDAENITIYLKTIIKPGDFVLSSIPSDAILEYYFYLHNIPYNVNFSDPDKIFAVVNKAEDPTDDPTADSKTIMYVLEGLKEYKLAASDFNTPKLIKDSEFSSTYEMTKIDKKRFLSCDKSKNMEYGSQLR